MQLITNKFSKALRLRVRAWTIGLLTPLGTLTASGLLYGFARSEAHDWLPWVGGVVGVVYLLSAVGLSRSAPGQPRDEADRASQSLKANLGERGALAP